MLLKKEDIECISLNIANNVKQTLIEQLQDIELQDILNNFNEKLKLIPHIENTTGYYEFPGMFKDSDDFSVRIPINTYSLSGLITWETIQNLKGDYTKIARNLVGDICSQLIKDLNNHLKDKKVLVLRRGLTLQKFKDPVTSGVILEISFRYRIIPDVKYIKTEKQLLKEVGKIGVSTKFLKGKSEPIRV